MSLKKGFWFFTALALLAFAGQASAGSNANAVVSLDLIADGGAGNGTDDGVTSGTVSGRGTTIAIEIFATGVRTSLIGMTLEFDFDSSLLSFVEAENSAFSLPIPEGSTRIHLIPATRNPVALASSGFLARAEFTTVSDVTGREFSIGIESVTLAESTTSIDELTTTSVITFNASPSPDFDGDNWVGFTDFLIFGQVFGSQQGDGTYDARMDLNSDGSIGFTDFLIFGQSFGGPPPSTGGGDGGNPDLVVQSPSVSNNNVASGASFTLGATVRNQGNGSSPATTLHYYRSTDATVSTSDTQVGTDAVRGLSASGASAESINLTAPAGSGTYYYGACVDAVAGESDTRNNCSASVTVTVTTQTPPATGASKLYWTDWGTNKIQRANLDGSGVEDLVSGAGLDGPDGLALDMAGGKMYWTDAGVNKIQRADLNGANVEDLVTGLGIPYGLALDLSGGKMYWTNRQTNKIQRADLSGANVEDLVTSGLTFPGGLALDASGGKMYWTNPGMSKIQRANLDGSGVEDLVTSGVSSPTGIALDVSGGKMYWTDRRTDKIQRSNLNGSGVEDLVTTGLNSPNGLALDVSGGKMYWADAGTNKVQRANLDGSGVEDLVTRADGLVVPSGVAVGTAPGSGGSGPGGGGGNGGGGASADLVVETPSVGSSRPVSGASFTLSATVRNRGTGSSAATTLRYYRSSNATISTSDTAVGTDAVGGLAASGASAESIGLTAPSATGTYYYGACVDAVTGESDTGNNCSASVTVTVGAAPAPDLVVLSPSVNNNSPAAGASLTLSATVRNTGNGSSAASTLRYYRSSDATISAGDTEVGTDAVGGLAASGASAESIGLTAPSATGTYYYGACVDAVTGESNTGNNCSASVTVTVGAAPAPDLVVLSPSVNNNSPAAGASLTLSATVRNTGNGSSAASTLRYYRSSDATISAGDTEVGTDAVGGLAASGASAESIGLTAPSGTGTYYYGACVDAVTGESNTGNNCSAAVSITVATVVPPTAEASKLYWTDWGTDKIQRGDLDGSNVEDLVSGAGLDGPDGLALDMAGGKMYWTDLNNNKIQRSDLDGANVEDLVTTGLSVPYGLALDVAGGKMYWTNRQNGKIQRGDLDGTNVEDLLTLAGLAFPGGIALDVANGKMYWTNPGSDKIQRADLDGTGLEDLVTSGLSSPIGLALDLSGGKMYWTDRGTHKIQRAGLDGSNVEDLVASGLTSPNGLDLDVSGGKMYWTDVDADKVQRADLDGSNVEDLLTSTDGLVDPSGVAVAVATVSAGGGSSSQTCAVGGKLNPGDTCSGSGYSLRNDSGVLVVDGNIGGITLGNTRFNANTVNLNNLRLTRSGNVWTIVSLP